MRAVVDNRDAKQVEGILHIRHVPSLNYAQVNVLSGERSWSVVPASIEVLALRVVTREELERADPLVDVPGWRWIDDLADANAAGLVRRPPRRLGGTWEELFAQLADRAKPMVDAGWSPSFRSWDSTTVSALEAFRGHGWI